MLCVSYCGGLILTWSLSNLLFRQGLSPSPGLTDSVWPVSCRDASLCASAVARLQVCADTLSVFMGV